MSFLIALVAGFTGLTITKDLSQKSFSQHKIAVSLASVPLELLHFFERRPKILFPSDSLVEFGILTMHYLDIASLQLCRPIYTVQGISFAFLSAISLCVAAI